MESFSNAEAAIFSLQNPGPKKNNISLARDHMMGSQLFGNDPEYHQDEVVDQNIDMAIQEDQEDHADEDNISDCSPSSKSMSSDGSTTRKLIKIEKKIQRTNLSKRERRLLQNRKSALKCRLKKQD